MNPTALIIQDLIEEVDPDRFLFRVRINPKGLTEIPRYGVIQHIFSDNYKIFVKNSYGTKEIHSAYIDTTFFSTIYIEPEDKDQKVIKILYIRPKDLKDFYRVMYGDPKECRIVRISKNATVDTQDGCISVDPKESKDPRIYFSDYYLQSNK